MGSHLHIRQLFDGCVQSAKRYDALGGLKPAVWPNIPGQPDGICFLELLKGFCHGYEARSWAEVLCQALRRVVPLWGPQQHEAEARSAAGAYS